MRWIGYLLGLLGLVGLLVAGTACDRRPADPASPERQILDLREKFYERLMADDRDAALQALEQMLLIDPQHPLIGALGTYLHYEEQTWDDAEAWLHASLPPGPGLSYGLGKLERFRRDPSAAESRAREALREYQRLQHESGVAHARVFLGDLLQRKPALQDEAITEYQAAIVVFRQLDDPLGEARALSKLARIERVRKNFDEALKLLYQALAILEGVGNKREQAVTWGLIGRTLRRARRPEEAVDALTRSLELQQQIRYREGQFRTLDQLATNYANLGDQSGVSRSFSEMAKLAEESGNQARLANVRFRLGRYHQDLESPDEAIEQLRLAVATDALDEVTAANAYRALGLALRQTGQLSAASEALQSALQRCDRIQSRESRRDPKARTLAALATLAYTNGELGQALLYFEHALQLWREAPPVKGEESEALNDLGMIHWLLGHPDSAKRYVEEGLALAREIDDRNLLGASHHNLAQLLAAEGRKDAALTHYRASLEIREALGGRRRLAITRLNLAGVLWDLGRRNEAERELAEALEGFRQVEDRESESFALNRSAEFRLSQGMNEAAIAIYSASIELSIKHGYQWSRYEAFAGRATAHERSGAIAAAAADLEQALEMVESLRARQETSELKMRFFAGKMALYERAIVLEARMEQGQAANAFQLVERARARSLIDSLTESRIASQVELSGDLAERERGLVDAVSSAAMRLASATDDEGRGLARQGLDAAEERLRSFELELRRTAPRYSDIVYPEPITLQQTRATVLQDNEILLRYFIGDEHAMLWVVRRDGARLHRLPHPDEIATLVEGFRNQVARAAVRLGGGVAGASEGERLAEALQVSGIPAGHRLLVVPDGPLHHVPFDALRVAGRYLVQDHEIVVVPSVTTLKLMRGELVSTASGGFLGIGDPVTAGDDPRFPPLRYSGEALERIAELFPADERVVLQGREATKELLRAQRLERFRFLHFATHGWLDAERPRYFGLQLSSAEEGTDEDYLYLDEVFSMRLRAELVVLAACRSGQGEMLAGEGLVGMTRGFLYAGARALLVTLWDVDDRASAEFMEAFYRELSEGSEIPAALRKVKLSFINSERAALRQAHRWAPFVLVGDTTHGSTTSKPKNSAGSVLPDS